MELTKEVEIEPEVKLEPGAKPETRTVPLLKRPGKKAARWIAETSEKVKFLMTRVGRPDEWHDEVRPKNRKKLIFEF